VFSILHNEVLTINLSNV